MLIEQLTVFIENRPGRLNDFTQVLADNGIDLIALSIAETAQFGIVRTIVSNNDAALKCLKEEGFTAQLTPVLAVAVSDTPGGLNHALCILQKNKISIEYLYTLMRRIGDAAIIIFRVDRPADAQNVLSESGIRLLTQDEIA